LYQLHLQQEAITRDERNIICKRKLF